MGSWDGKAQKELDADPGAVLKKVLDIGFCYLEPANHSAANEPGTGLGIPASKLAELLKSYEARACSAHIGGMNDGTLRAVMEYNRTLDNRNLVVPIDFFTGYDHIMRVCEHYNHVGGILIENGFNPLVYHNHYHEFQEVNGKPVLYHIVENTDPKYLHFEMDTVRAMTRASLARRRWKRQRGKTNSRERNRSLGKEI